MTGGKLEGVDTAEGVAEEHGLREVEVREEGFQIAEVVGALVCGCVAGVAVASLIERDDAPSGREGRGQGHKGRGFHQVAVESDERVCADGGVEIGECEAVVLEGVALKLHGRGLVSSFMVLDKELG